MGRINICGITIVRNTAAEAFRLYNLNRITDVIPQAKPFAKVKKTAHGHKNGLSDIISMLTKNFKSLKIPFFIIAPIVDLTSMVFFT